jgi:hypothetical protein
VKTLVLLQEEYLGTLIPEDKTDSIRQLIEHLKGDPRNLEMWFEMEKLYDSPAKRSEILKGILLLDPGNIQAQEALTRLDASTEDKGIVAETPRPEVPAAAASAVKSLASPPRLSESAKLEDDFRPCPYCAERIRVKAVKCRFCGEYLDGRPKPVESKPAPQPTIRTAALVVLAVCAVVILVVLVFLLAQVMKGGSLFPGY